MAISDNGARAPSDPSSVPSPPTTIVPPSANIPASIVETPGLKQTPSPHLPSATKQHNSVTATMEISNIGARAAFHPSSDPSTLMSPSPPSDNLSDFIMETPGLKRTPSPHLPSATKQHNSVTATMEISNIGDIGARAAFHPSSDPSTLMTPSPPSAANLSDFIMETPGPKRSPSPQLLSATKQHTSITATMENSEIGDIGASAAFHPSSDPSTLMTIVPTSNHQSDSIMHIRFKSEL
jgi:hypothetical protein